MGGLVNVEEIANAGPISCDYVVIKSGFPSNYSKVFVNMLVLSVKVSFRITKNAILQRCTLATIAP